MKLLNYCFLFFLLCLGVSVARAQTPCVTLPNDPTAFFAVDANGVEVQAFCVGQPVNFVQRPGRNLNPTFFRYGVMRGANKDFSTATPVCDPGHPLPYTYTPTAADIGDVTVSENVNPGGGLAPTYYIRNYKVYGTPAPNFRVEPCPNSAVLVTLRDSTYDSYQVQAGGGPLTTITRTQPVVLLVGSATAVTVIGSYGLNDRCTGSSALPIPALLPAVPPLFTQLALQGALPGGGATFAVSNLPAGYKYTLEIDNGSGFVRVADVPAGTTSLSLPNAVAGCYRVRRADVCGGSPATSPTICTLSLAGSSTQNRNQLLLTTNASPSTTYSVTRNGAALTTFTVTADGLEDADVQCGTKYTYRVTANQPGGMAVSNEVTITTVSALPPRQPQLLASFNLNNVVLLTPLLAVPLTTGSSLRYRRAAGAQPPVDFGSPATTSRIQRDSTALADLLAQPPCYSVRLTDVCRNPSPESAPACPALLTASAADPAGTTAALSWTSFAGPNPSLPASYTLQGLDPSSNVISNRAVSSNRYTDLTPPTDRQVLRYRLQVSGAGLPAGTFSYSNLVSITRQLSINIPTAFTPNGDGLNDVLEVKGKYLSNYVFVVVDRNGQEVFRGTQRSETWDGTIKGHAPVLGAYVWRFQQNNEEGKPFTASGSVTILK